MRWLKTLRLLIFSSHIFILLLYLPLLNLRAQKLILPTLFLLQLHHILYSIRIDILSAISRHLLNKLKPIQSLLLPIQLVNKSLKYLYQNNFIHLFSFILTLFWNFFTILNLSKMHHKICRKLQWKNCKSPELSIIPSYFLIKIFLNKFIKSCGLNLSWALTIKNS